MTETYKIHGFFRLSKLSIALIPVFVRNDRLDNCLYISIQDSELKNEKFVLFQDIEKFQVIYPPNNMADELSRNTFSINSPGVVCYLHQEKDGNEKIVVNELKDFTNNVNTLSDFSNNLCYSNYSLLKLTSPSISKIFDWVTSLPLGADKVWRESEVSFAQKTDRYWRDLKSARIEATTNLSESVSALGYGSLEDALRWLMDHPTGSFDPHEDSKWVSLWERLFKYNVDREVLYSLASEYLLYHPYWDQNFFRIFSKVYRELNYSLFRDVAERMQDDFFEIDTIRYPTTFDEAARYLQIWQLFMIGMYNWTEPEWSIDETHLSSTLKKISLRFTNRSIGEMRSPPGEWTDYKFGLYAGCELIERLDQYPKLAGSLFAMILSTLASKDLDLSDLRNLLDNAIWGIYKFLIDGTDKSFAWTTFSDQVKELENRLPLKRVQSQKSFLIKKLTVQDLD